MRLKWAPEALEDRLSIFDYLAKDNPRAALAMDELFLKASADLVDFPMMGKQGIISGTRELLPHEHYRLVYEVHDDEIWVMAVISTSQLWPPLK